MADIDGSLGHLVDGADVRLRLLLEILSVDRVQVVRPLGSHLLHRLVTLRHGHWLIIEVPSVCGAPVETVAFGELHIEDGLLVMGIGILLPVLGAVGGGSVEGLFVGDIDVVLDVNLVLGDLLGPELLQVLRSGVERNVLCLVLDPGHQFLPHLGFGPGVVLPILGVYVVVGLVGLGF